MKPHEPTTPLGLTRREFLKQAGAGAASVTLLASILESCGDALVGQCGGAGVACRVPTTDDERTFVAIADTVVPGCASDPDGRPGAVEGCVLNLASDPALRVSTFVPLLVSVADTESQSSFGRRFVELSLEERTQVLAQAESLAPTLSYAFRFFRAAHYGGLYNDAGPRSLGYPGGNLGYIDDADFSFRRPIGSERTKDGNMS